MALNSSGMEGLSPAKYSSFCHSLSTLRCLTQSSSI